MKKPPLISLLRAAPALTAACALFSGAVAQAQPFIDTTSPDGLVQFQPTNKFSFTMESTVPSGVSAANIMVTLYTTNLSWVQAAAPLVITTTNGMVVSGTPALRVVTVPLTATNVQYTAVIQATDLGGTLLQTNTFDTITPSYTWEAEDWDYNGGQFIDNPQTNAYAGLSGTFGVDAYNPNGGGTSYRPNDTGDPGNEGNTNVKRVQYTDPNNAQTDYDFGWSNGGTLEWANYTRHYPAGKWNIFARCAGWATETDSADMFLGGTNGTRLGRFAVPLTCGTSGTGAYQCYGWAPLIDIAGNLIEWDTDGSKQTLTLQTIQGSWNMNFFMLMPVNPNYKPVPFVSATSPNSTQMFPLTNLFTFNVNSVPGISQTGIVVTVNGITPYGLTYSGSSRVLSGSFPIATNAGYSVTIVATDANGSSTYTTTFGTFSAKNYTWECEDWDYQNGQFIDNPQTNAYAGLAGIAGVDANNSQGGGTTYRSNDTGDLGNEANGDATRVQYTSAGLSDYDIGWTASGNWANYTRTYPKGVFGVMFRAAGNSGGTDMARLLEVTSGVGTSSQTTTSLGQFNVPNTGGWQTYTWAPLVDSTGNAVTITNSGSVKTFQLYQDAGGWNGNFLMLIPTDTTKPTFSQIYPDGSAMFQHTNTLSFVVKSASNINPGLVSVTLNGVAVPNLTFSGPATNLTVSCPVQPETGYRATLGVNTTNNDPAVLSFVFDTSTAGYYTWEAEDFDYEGGKFFDNPQTNAYYGLQAIIGVDGLNTNNGATAYRPVAASGPDGNQGNEVASDLKRPQYGAGASDYDVGWTGTGNWANYTRTYPTGVFNVRLRASSPSGQTNAASLLRVTSGLGTSNQTTTALGIFNAPYTGGWETYDWATLVDTNGSPVIVTNSGAVSTFQLYQNNGGWNANFFELVPPMVTGPKLTVVRTAGNVTISWAPTGGRLEASPALGASANWQPIGTANPAVVPITGAAQFFRVISP